MKIKKLKCQVKNQRSNKIKKKKKLKKNKKSQNIGARFGFFYPYFSCTNHSLNIIIIS